MLDDLANVVADELAERLVLHRHVRLAPNVVAELPLHRRKHRLHVAAIVIVLQELITMQGEVCGTSRPRCLPSRQLRCS